MFIVFVPQTSKQQLNALYEIHRLSLLRQLVIGEWSSFWYVSFLILVLLIFFPFPLWEEKEWANCGCLAAGRSHPTTHQTWQSILSAVATSGIRFSLAPFWQFDMHPRIFKDFKTWDFNFSHDYYRYYVWTIARVIHRRLQRKELCSREGFLVRPAGEAGCSPGAERAPGAGRGAERDPSAPAGANNFHGSD